MNKYQKAKVILDKIDLAREIRGDDTAIAVIADYLEEACRKALDEELKFLERVKLELDVCICGCGEKWDDTDLADLVNKRIAKRREELGI